MKKHLYISLTLFLLFLLLIPKADAQESKSSGNYQNNSIIFQTRDSLWVKDTLGCLNYRDKQASVIEENKDQYIGKSEAEIKEIFGKPTYKKVCNSEIRYTYYLAVSPDCETIYSEKLTWNEIEAGTGLDFTFNKGKLTGIAFWIQ